MPRLCVRFTMRRMMAAVAVMAVAMGTVEGLRRRRASFLRRASECSQKAGYAGMAKQVAWFNNRWAYDQRADTAYDHLGEHYNALRVKYEQAAAHPWWFVGPDPPEPVWPTDVPRY
ncbi:MAG: hypothetical protein ACLQIB_21805 [Isosphaeraceae bacterium]